VRGSLEGGGHGGLEKNILRICVLRKNVLGGDLLRRGRHGMEVGTHQTAACESKAALGLGGGIWGVWSRVLTSVLLGAGGGGVPLGRGSGKKVSGQASRTGEEEDG